MLENHVQIPTLGLQHFCIKHNNVIDELQTNYLIKDLSDKQTLSDIDWTFIYKEDESSKKFILLTDINSWNYLIWKHWDFNTNILLAVELSKILNTTVNYYFVDSQIATSRWIFAESGKLLRAHYESHGKVLYNEGYNEVETKLRKRINETFVEDLYWELYENTSLSLENFNKEKRKEVKLYTGNLCERKSNS